MPHQHADTGPIPDCADLADPLAQTVFDSLSAHIAILDQNGVILETNRAWRDYARSGGISGGIDSVGVNYLAVCDAAEGEEAGDAAAVAAGIRAVIAGEALEFLYDYPCHSPEGKRWYYMRAVRVVYAGPVRVVASHEDITALKLAEASLRRHERELEEKAQSLEEANIALKVLLQQREADRSELEQKVLANTRQLVMPYVEKLKSARLSPRDRTLVDIVERHLEDIISPFLQRLSTAQSILTPQEIQVAVLVREGKTSKEIADVLNVSVTTVHFHRKNLRTKFGLTNQQKNLRSHLLTLA